MTNRISTLIFMAIFLFIGGTLAAQSSPVGWAAANGGTTGGEGGETVTVTTRGEFVTYAVSSDPLIIRIRDTINLNLYERVKVNANKTIIGITENAMLRYGGLDIYGDNVIVRNLIIRDSYDGDWSGKTHSTDAITIASQNVWVDHCWLSTSADGLLDVRSNNSNEIGDYVTVSYTRFSDHNKVSLIGSSDDSVRDRDHLKVTFHHCWFDGTLDKGLHQRLPRIRYGDVHMYNNYFENVVYYCVLARLESDVVVENNYFRNSLNPHGLRDFGLGEKDPELVASGNVYELSGGEKDTSGDAFDPTSFYDYELDDPMTIPAFVMNEAGPFNRRNNQDPIAVTDVVFMESGERSFELDLTLNDSDPDGDAIRMGNIVGELEGIIFTRNNIIRYVAPSSPEKNDTVLYEVIDTEGGYTLGTLIVEFEGVSSSIQEELVLEELNIYPIPARDVINISFNMDQNKDYEISLWDTTGKKIITNQSNHVIGGKWYTRIDGANISTAIIFIRIRSENAVLTRKVSVLK